MQINPGRGAALERCAPKNMKMKSIYLILFTFLIIPTFGQMSEPVVILESGDSLYKIKPKKTFITRFTMVSTLDSAYSITKYYNGNIISVTSSALQIIPTYELINETIDECSNIKTGITYPPDASPIFLNKEDISMIRFQTNAGNSSMITGTVLTFIGALTTSVIAPLISINYNTGEINSDRYINCALTGVGFCVISIPLFVVSKEKKFRLKPQANANEQLWHIK